MEDTHCGAECREEACFRIDLMQVLVVEPPESALPEGTRDLLCKSGWDVITATDYASALETARTGPIAAVVLASPRPSNGESDERPGFEELLRVIDLQQIATIVLDDPERPYQPNTRSLIEVLTRNISPAELRGRLSMIQRHHAHVRRMELELRRMEKLGKRLNDHFREVDEEMRLAARLQRDFLPRVVQPVGNVQVAALYRPASWVSGDIYDVIHIDEHHTGFYVADAVGHGLAASLLTMFIKRAVVSKQVDGEGYRVLSPSDTLERLNMALADQALPNHQFVTACYCVLNHETLTLRYARGGHPYPILITPDGTLTELKTAGGLLGLFPGEEFPTFETQLRPGDKLLLYTDGMELAFQGERGESFDTTAYHRVFESLARMPIEPMLRQLERRLDAESASPNPHDDLTVVGLEVLDTDHSSSVPKDGTEHRRFAGQTATCHPTLPI